MWIILLWFTLVPVVGGLAPSWNSVTLDGDFAYLPEDCVSVKGQKLLKESFSGTGNGSQMVIGVVRNSGSPSKIDLFTAYHVAAKLHNLYGASLVARSDNLTTHEDNSSQTRTSDGRLETNAESSESTTADDSPTEANRAKPTSLDLALEQLDLAIDLYEKLLEHLGSLKNDSNSNSNSKTDTDTEKISAAEKTTVNQLAATYLNRSFAFQKLGNSEESKSDREFANELNPDLAKVESPQDLTIVSLPISAIWTSQTEAVGSKLIEMKRDKAFSRLCVLHLDSEFMAMENIPLFEWMLNEIEETQRWKNSISSEDIDIVVSGSAAIGSDLLLASKESIDYTELYAVVLVVLILAFVYRSPLLVCVPLISISVSLAIATALLSSLTQLHELPGFSWWEFKVFKTTRIFIVVILYGAGTDYCLFLISRFREEIRNGLDVAQAVERSLSQVGNALVASALTTILGLGMMYFSEFGKLKFSGPAICVSLTVTLLACITLAPAILRGLGKFVFWPLKIDVPKDPQATKGSAPRLSLSLRFWTMISEQIVRYPGRVLVISFALLFPLAIQGINSSKNVTYDLLGGLERSRPSRAGTDKLKAHFPVGESGPITVIAKDSRTGFLAVDGEIDFERRDQIELLTEELANLEGVQHVRSLSRPLGEQPCSIVSESIRALAFTRAAFVTQVPELNYGVTRFEVVTQHDVFAKEANDVLHRVVELLDQESQQANSPWSETQFALAGTTAAMSDLREVTESDNLRIQILVVCAVYFVLVVLLRRPLISAYMLFTVLVSFFVTMAVTEFVFSRAYGDDFSGLEWKVPLFLYVILVAIGEDYNVYLATRVFEEQERLGPIKGLKQAVICTGGIITSCGLIMAGTFVSMTSSSMGISTARMEFLGFMQCFR